MQQENDRQKKDQKYKKKIVSCVKSRLSLLEATGVGVIIPFYSSSSA